MRFRRKAINAAPIAACLIILLTSLAAAGERIQDNSFLVEEAYNQEEGVVQHINAFQYMRKSKEWQYTFTQEWPVFSQAHQFSYTIPVIHKSDGSGSTGLGDLALNYRYQLVLRDEVAVAPRLSLLAPSGDYRRGLGSDAWGYQFNLPVSLTLSEKMVSHFNLGITYVPESREPTGGKADTVAYNAGASLIYNLVSGLDLMLEGVWYGAEKVIAANSTERENTFLLNPGFRFAIDFKSGLQVVPGIAFPIGFDAARDDYGVLFYLSFEHPFTNF